MFPKEGQQVAKDLRVFGEPRQTVLAHACHEKMYSDDHLFFGYLTPICLKAR